MKLLGKADSSDSVLGDILYQDKRGVASMGNSVNGRDKKLLTSLGLESFFSRH